MILESNENNKLNRILEAMNPEDKSRAEKIMDLYDQREKAEMEQERQENKNEHYQEDNS